MPTLPQRPCPVPCCPSLSPCPVHKAKARQIITTPQPRLYDDRRGSSTARGYGYAWQQKRKDFITRHPFCVRDGKQGEEVDHIIPKRLGGSDDDSNLQTLCGTCHRGKTGRERRRL